MISLTERSNKLEILDGDDITFEDIKKNMQELNFINTYLGGHKITVAGFKAIYESAKDKSKTFMVCELGCGGGDNLAAIDRWCKSKNISVAFVGIDINPNCIAYAKMQYPTLNATWRVADYREVAFTQKPDLMFSSLFCHHFSNESIIEMLQWKKENTALGFFINDLERNYFAYHSIKIITKLFSSSYLVKNDACLSVARGFKKMEWRQLLADASLLATVKWKWAFRHLIVFKHD